MDDHNTVEGSKGSEDHNVFQQDSNDSLSTINKSSKLSRNTNIKLTMLFHEPPSRKERQSIIKPWHRKTAKVSKEMITDDSTSSSSSSTETSLQMPSVETEELGVCDESEMDSTISNDSQLKMYMKNNLDPTTTLDGEEEEEEEEEEDDMKTFKYPKETKTLLKILAEESGLTPLQRRMLICILDESINKLVILGASLPQYKSVINFEGAEIRYKEEQKVPQFNHLTNERMNCEERMREIKFQQDRDGILKILSILREEILQNDKPLILNIFLTLDTEKRYQNDFILKSEQRYKKQLNMVKRVRDRIEIENKNVTQKIQDYVKPSQVHLERMQRAAMAQVKYNYKWQKARCEQNRLIMQREIRKENEYLEKLEEQTVKEIRAHSETLKYLDVAIKQMTKNLERWTAVYQKDTSYINNENANLEKHIANTQLKLEAVQDSIKERAIEITELRREKVIRDETIARELLTEKSIIKIQAWWRGMMVRWEFGRYRDIMRKKFRRQRRPRK